MLAPLTGSSRSTMNGTHTQPKSKNNTNAAKRARVEDQRPGLLNSPGHSRGRGDISNYSKKKKKKKKTKRGKMIRCMDFIRNSKLTL